VASQKEDMMIRIERLTTISENVTKAIDKLLRQLSDNRPQEPFSACDIIKCWENGYCYIFLAIDTSKKKSERIVGMGVIFFQKTPSHWLAEIHDIVVDEACQNQGIGTAIVKELIQTAQTFAKTQNMTVRLSLTSKPKRNTEHFYRQFGFELRSRAEGKRGTNLYRMIIAP